MQALLKGVLLPVDVNGDLVGDYLSVRLKFCRMFMAPAVVIILFKNLFHISSMKLKICTCKFEYRTLFSEYGGRGLPKCALKFCRMFMAPAVVIILFKNLFHISSIKLQICTYKFEYRTLFSEYGR